jgi:Zn-dependent peptidase ImmA (M78 family)/RNA polymerase subunit RPABC4/transcription elongation factor Spt4
MSSSIRRYYHSFIASQYLLSISDISKFPINIYNFINASNILMSTKIEYEKWNTQINNQKCSLNIKDARCFYKPEINVYLIVYDDTKPKNRIRFSLAHEFAHIILGHLNDKRTEILRGGLDESTYWRFEGEANTFAGNFLAPPILINERLKDLNGDPNRIISETFLLSKAASSWRYNDYKYWLGCKHHKSEQKIYKRYHKLMNPRFCFKCGNLFYNKDANFCQICGDAKLSKRWRKDCMIYNDGAETNANNRVVKCPRCENEDINSDEEYCKICGAPVFNKCEDYDEENGFGEFCTMKGCERGKLLDGNARYCPYCGHKTNFFRNGLLKPWEKAKKEIEAQEEETSEQVAATSIPDDESQNEPDDSSNGDFIEIDDNGDLPF